MVDIGCPELAGLKVNIAKAEANGWSSSDGEIFKFILFNSKYVLTICDLLQQGDNLVIVDVYGQDNTTPYWDIYTCHCENVPPPSDPNIHCVNFTSSIINQIREETTDEIIVDGNMLPLLLAIVSVIGVGAFLLLRKR